MENTRQEDIAPNNNSGSPQSVSNAIWDGAVNSLGARFYSFFSLRYVFSVTVFRFMGWLKGEKILIFVFVCALKFKVERNIFNTFFVWIFQVGKVFLCVKSSFCVDFTMWITLPNVDISGLYTIKETIEMHKVSSLSLFLQLFSIPSNM